MKYKIIKSDSDGWSFNDDVELIRNFGLDDDGIFLKFLIQIPNITKIDILEYFELAILELCYFYEPDMSRNYYIHEELDKKFGENSPNATYASEFYAVMGQLFLAGFIDFGVEDGNLDELGTDFDTNLSKIDLDMTLYEKWIYFRNNYFYKKKIYKSGFDKDEYENIKFLFKDMWRHPCTWLAYMPWICITKNGEKYLKEVLSPKIYNKYKNIEIEIDDNGEILWQGVTDLDQGTA